jgi:adenylyl- and sulfurtransferase ThiI
MQEIILIRFSELTLKGKNRSSFSKQLYRNILNKLNRFDFESKLFYDKIEIYPKSNTDDLLNELRYVIGIS